MTAFVVATVNASGDPSCGCAADIALQEIGEHYRLIFENSEDVILFASPDGAVYSANPAACRLFGKSEEEIKRCGRYGIMDMSDPRLAAALAERRRTGRFKGELNCIGADGRSFPVELSTTIFLNARGEERSTIIIRDISERKQAEREIEASRDQLRQLASQLVQVREEERTAIAREIHDELGQELTALNMNISGLIKRLAADPELHEQAVTMRHSIDGMIREVRRIATALRPGLLDELGLAAAVEWHARKFMQESGIECTVEVDPAIGALPQPIATAMFRIFQESLTNAARHSRATAVRATLAKHGNALYLCVDDNGCGITGEVLSNAKSIGILGMKERALALGGTVAFTSAPGSGTTVTTTIPLHFE